MQIEAFLVVHHFHRHLFEDHVKISNPFCHGSFLTISPKVKDEFLEIIRKGQRFAKVFVKLNLFLAHLAQRVIVIYYHTMCVSCIIYSQTSVIRTQIFRNHRIFRI